MKVHQIYTNNQLRNFNYIIELEDQSAIVVDPWDACEINNYLNERHLILKTIINTHEHWDHVQGNLALVQKHGCEVWAHENAAHSIPGFTHSLKNKQIINLDDNNQLIVLDTPGHTLAHLCFMLISDGQQKAIFTGDTLFNAGVGHCRLGGEERLLYNTIIKNFYPLEDQIIIYPGHDYLENNLRFTLKFEPSNQQAKKLLEKVTATDYVPGNIQTNIAEEKQFNLFMRLDNIDVINNLSLNQPIAEQVFIALRSQRDKW